jgi:beta-xylosidase
MDDEDHSIYHVLKQQKRREIQAITQIRDTDGIMHKAFKDIAATFVRHLAQKFGPLEVDPHALITVFQHLQPTDPQKYATHLDRPIKMDEVYRAIHAGVRRKTPGLDGICL